MTRWNPHEFFENGIKSDYAEKYLNVLIDHGEAIDEKNVPVVFTLSHLAHCSKTLYSDLHDFVARSGYSNDFPYRHFPIKKRSGGTRWISVPVPPLWAVQSWISKNILKRIPPHHCSMAYADGCSPFKNASKHCNARWLLKLDIADFFGNISERQIFHVFQSLGYTPLLSFEMARLCTKIGHQNTGKRWESADKWYEIQGYSCRKVGCLPQGAPTSPMLSNLVSREMDAALYKIARSRRAIYSRYADDLTFSFRDGNRQLLLEVKEQVAEVVRKNGFNINSKKTNIVPPGARKIVTGLIVNDENPTLQKKYKDRIRAHLYFCKNFGVANHCKALGFKSILGFRNHLEGLISYAFGVDKKLGGKYFDEFMDIDWGKFEI